MTVLQRFFVKGLIVVLPISLTLSLLVWATFGLEGLFGGWIKGWLGEENYIPGLGLLIVFVLILSTGFLVGHYFIAQIYSIVNHLLEKVPLLNSIYRPLRDLIMFLGKKDGELGQNKVVQVEIAPDVQVIGLLMRDSLLDMEEMDPQSQELCAVYVPLSFMLGGHTLLVPRSKLKLTTLKVDRALNLALTGWVKVKENLPDTKN